MPTPPSPFFSERWARPAGAAPFADTFQARVPAVPLEPAHDRPPDAGANGNSNANSNATSAGPTEENRGDQGTSTDADRTSRPEPDVSHR